ncbi:I78 family peptidase inhibitor [Plastorhodobacter daqingensis]|uniref:I78 family peptidase inhibitor n=1 Tax=Plastorhodobacter daqingensis TaxID=1387281 RepID=A0ABW2UM66_9RHOB
MTRASCLAVLGLAMALGACAPLPPTEDTPETTSCGAEGFQNLLGQNRNVLATMAFTGPVRVIGPDDMVTMDYLPHRINFDVDSSGRIQNIRCG